MNVGIVKFIFFVHFCHIFVGASYKYGLKEENVQVVNILKNIFKNYISIRNYNVLITTNFRHLERAEDVEDILSELLTRIDNVPIILAPMIDKDIDDSVELTVFFMESEDDVINIPRIMQSKFLIVLLQSGSLDDVLQFAWRIFNHFFEMYITDVTILINGTIDGTDDIKMYTYFPYQPSSCGSVKPVLMKRFNEMETSLNIWDSIDVFPNKIGNFYGCPLKVITWEMVPFVVYKRNLQNEDIFEGFDISILKLFAQKLNFTLKIEKNKPDNLMGGNIFRNGTITGAYQKLNERKTNMTIGTSTCTSTRMSLFSTIMPYFQMNYILLLKTSDHYTSFEVLLFPFDVPTWCLLLVFAVLRFFLPSTFRFFRRLPKSCINMTHGLYLILFFTLRVSYECSFYKFIRFAPTKPLPLTINEVIEQNYSIIADHAKYRMLETLPDLNSNAHVVPGQPVDAIAALEHAPAKTAVFTGKFFLSYYLNNNPHKLNELAIVSEPVLESKLCIYFTRHSYLTDVFNRELLHMRGSGILLQISDLYDYNYMPITTATLKHYVKKSSRAEVIGFDVLDGVFKGLLCMECLAFGIFLIELLHGYYSKRIRGK